MRGARRAMHMPCSGTHVRTRAPRNPIIWALSTLDSRKELMADGTEKEADNPTTPMPTHCQRHPCNTMPDTSKLVKNWLGFMVCPICHASYGRAP